MLAEVRALGFEYAELGHGTRLSLLDGVQQAVAAGEIKISSVHNFCPVPLAAPAPLPDYYLPSSRRERERELAVRHTLRTIECAAALGAKVVVLHLGLVPMRNYTARLLELAGAGRATPQRCERLRERALAVRQRRRGKYLEQVFRTLDEVVPRARQLGVMLAMETRAGIEEIPDETEAAEIIARFGADVMAYWHDVGHALLKEGLGLLKTESVLERFRGRTAGMHLQDFVGPALDHLPPGFGTFDFGRLRRFVSEQMLLVWEIHPQWTAGQILDGVRRVQELLSKPVEV
jgi:sugar phosphate isomerase/epimerase